LHGCTVGDNSLIGMGATILNDVKKCRTRMVGMESQLTSSEGTAI